MHQITLTYDESMVRKAIFRFWKRTVGLVYMLALVLMTILFAILLYQGNRSWLVGALGAVLLISFLMILTLYLVHFRNAWYKFKEMGSPVASFIAAENSATISSSAGSSTFPWSAIKEVWRYDDLWLFFFSKSQFVTFPSAQVSEEVQTYILQRIEHAGGRID
ncbi:YcxB family protein [Legionella erythra]|uniref:YcxB-like C-terminal domain-containing protein n=1 Tax=Legionella erythra TaxID=448 RepID=A0A0W0TS11_LEGER|nr:YcxB family protein [Legionella erythra]KTC98434.1 hypothetical protein Lery_0902 [Legionella erythra]